MLRWLRGLKLTEGLLFIASRTPGSFDQPSRVVPQSRF